MEELHQKMKLVYDICARINNNDIIILSKFLKNRIENPDSFIVLLGETSSGKSSLLNGLIGENILYVSSSPSTGSIIEIAFNKESKEKVYYAINKDATMEIIDNKVFDDLVKKPDKDLERLRLETNINNYNFNGLRLFDTPGYNSIVSDHEEILKEFIPNSDAVIYIVNYKIGIQESDFTFLNFLKELLRDNIDISIVINRVPKGKNSNDKRIKEILQYAKDIFNYEPEHFIVETILCEEDYPLPKADNLWKYVENKIHSKEREEALKRNFNSFILDLFYKCEAEVNKRYQSIKLSRKEKEDIKKEVKEFQNKKAYAIDLINETFDKLEKKIEKEMPEIKNKVYPKICADIDSKEIGLKDETISYINRHLLPFTIAEEISELQRYILIELEDLNKKLNDYLNKEINRFVGKIEIIFSSFMDQAELELTKKISSNFLTQGLLSYFAKYGGAGKAAAGVANAASHLLKKVGDIFGTKFSLTAHNSLKHFLSKIGATSAKAVGTAGAVIVEVAFIVLEYATWKPILKKRVSEGLDLWYNETKPSVIKDLNDLKDENINNINEIFDNKVNSYNYEEEIPNEKETIELLKDIEKIRREIGA